MTATREVGRTTLDVLSDEEVAITRVIRAPRPLVWEAWTRCEHLGHWLGVSHMELAECEMDVRPGGAFRWLWTGGEGHRMQITGEFLEVDELARLVSSESWEGWQATVNTVTFEEVDGGTEIVITMRYPSKDARDAALATPMLEGMDAGYEMLETYLGSL